MAATVNADHAIAMLDEEQHLGVPVVGAERPAMMEDDRLAVTPVLVEDVSAVFRFDKAHVSLPRELAPLFVVSRLRFSVHRLCHSSASFLQCRDREQPPTCRETP